MNLSKKKSLAARALNVGKDRVFFSAGRLEEIKEAITKQDIKDLYKEGIIKIKNIKGRKTNIKKRRRRSTGNIRKKVNKRKKNYVIMTRKLRSYVSELKKQDRINADDSKEIRKKIRNKSFRSKAHLREHIGGLKKWLFKKNEE